MSVLMKPTIAVENMYRNVSHLSTNNLLSLQYSVSIALLLKVPGEHKK